MPFVISTAERERRETPPSTLVYQCRPLLGRVGAPGPTGAVQTNHADQGSGVMRSGGELRQSRKRSHSGVSRPTGAVQKTRYQSFRPAPSAAHCYARKDARSQRRANPKRRRTAFDDTAVLIASPAFSRVSCRASRQTGRSGGVARGGILGMSCTPPFAAVGCRPAASLPPPKAAKRLRPPRAARYSSTVVLNVSVSLSPGLRTRTPSFFSMA